MIEVKKAMIDDELERLRRRKLAQLSRRFLSEKGEKKEEDKQDLLKKVFVGRALEVFSAAQAQYPEIADKLRDVLVQLVSSGKLTRLSGQELYSVLGRMGLRVRLKTTIRIKEHGKLKLLEEKLKEKP